MKPYFAKYLPVGKEIKSNKWQWYNNVQNIGWENISPSDMDAIIAHGLQPPPEFRKVKLFLCSRDIQVGDNVYEPTLEVEGLIRVGIYPLKKIDYSKKPESWIELDYAMLKGAYKVIGEISPKATWVKEGDEFDEDELYYLLGGRSVRRPMSKFYTEKNEWRNYPEDITIYIKGHCGHFH